MSPWPFKHAMSYGGVSGGGARERLNLTAFILSDPAPSVQPTEYDPIPETHCKHASGSGSYEGAGVFHSRHSLRVVLSL